jgi:predicted O-methyltransferase YrrM
MTRWTVDNEVELLKRYAKNTTHGVVEIGVFDGETTAEMASVTNNPIYAIDPIITDSMIDIIGNVDSILKHMSKHPNIVFICDYSYNVIFKFKNKFDFIFIDGDHSYDGVRRDYEMWLPFLEYGGYIAFHDSAPTEDGRFGGWPGPTQLADEVSKELEFIERVDTIRVFRKGEKVDIHCTDCTQ